MLEIAIPRDIREYQPKFIGSFTMRQVICIMIIMGIFAINSFIQTNILGFTQVIYLTALVPASIPFAFGWGEKLIGMPVEKYVMIVFTNQILAPKHRYYRTHNYISIIEKKIEAEETEDENRKKKPKKIKKQLIPADLMAYD